jgi:hypothetical protein
MSDVIHKAGKYGYLKESHEPRLIAHNFLVLGITPLSGYHAFDVTHGIGENAWGMDGNAEYGDCGFAALDHYNVSKTGNVDLIGKFGTPKYPSLIDAYFAYGIAQGEPGPHPDQGVSNATVLAWAVQQGFIYGYAEVQPEYLDWFASEFRGALLGLAIDGVTASNDFNDYPRHTWNTMEKLDGHDTLYVKSKGEGQGTLVTWGGLQPFSKSFRENNVTDSWVIFDQYDPRVNWPTLEAALAEVNGTDVPPAS